MEYIKRPIPLDGLDGYSVNEIGEVFARDGVSKISQNINSRGYYKVSLYVTGVGKRTFSVHRLVALAFIPVDDPTGLDADHIDNNRLNNHASNLQWLTRGENIAKSYKQGRVNARKGQLKGKLSGFYLSFEAIELLNQVGNKSEYIDNLILSSLRKKAELENTPPNKNWKPSTLEDKEISKTLAGDLIADDHKKIIALATPTGEHECCQHPTRPCKHWQWDVQSGEGYKNILSGRFREAD